MKKLNVLLVALLLSTVVLSQNIEKQTVVGIAEEYHEIEWYEQPYWYWRVQGIVDNDTSEWSTHRIFYTEELVTSTEDKTVQLVLSNPFSNHLVLKVPNIQYAELFDMNGRLVYEGEGMYISTAHLEEGYYILQLQTEGKVLSQMLLKKKIIYTSINQYGWQGELGS